MRSSSILSRMLHIFFRFILGRKAIKGTYLGKVRRIIVIRPHNQLGDLLTGVPLYRALKEKYPDAHMTAIVSPVNAPALTKSVYIDRLVVFDKKQLTDPPYFARFINVLFEEYDLAVVPVTVSMSFTSNLIAGLSRARVKIGPASLDGEENISRYFFDRQVELDWRRFPDMHVSEKTVDIVRPYGIRASRYESEVNFDAEDAATARKIIEGFGCRSGQPIIGIHVGAGKAPNRWDHRKFASLIDKLNSAFDACIYLTGTDADMELIEFVRGKVFGDVNLVLNKPVPLLAAVISQSTLFISNDTGTMHIAGATNTPLISLFGPTNPHQWAPIGENKRFLRHSDLIDDITIDEVFNQSRTLLLQEQFLADA